jgi:hypothetical protein
MSDQIQTIKGIIDEHESIDEQIRQALRAIEDWQLALESTIASGEASQVESLAAKQWSQVQAIDSLEQGMLGHYRREEQELLEFIGPVISEGLRVQHRELQEQLRSVRILLTCTDLKSLEMTELAARYPNVKKELEDIYRLIGEDVKTEDTLLRLVLKGIVARS